MTEKDLSMLDGTERAQEYVDRLTAIVGQMKSAPAEAQNPVIIALFEMFIDWNKQKIEAVRNGSPLVCTWYGNIHEVYAGMGILAYNPVVDLMMHLGFTDYADAKKCDSFPLDQNICSLVRYAVYAVHNRLLPRPKAFISMSEPCDGQLMLHQAFHQSDFFKDIPYFQIDPTYGHEDSDFEYVAEQIYDMIAFLEKHTGAKYVFEDMAKVVEESNKQYRVLKELGDCMKQTPAPLPSFVVPEVCWPLTQHLPAGDPKATHIMEMLLGAAKMNLQNHVAAVPNEQIRVLWPDLDPLWNGPISEWMAKEWGAVVVNSFQGYADQYHMVDTSDEHKMFFGLARRATAEVPMIRQGRGWVDVFVEDVTNMISSFNCNAVIASGHMGHKDVAGQGAFLKKVCKDMDVPVLSLTSSLFDERYLPFDRMKNDIDNFFSTCGFKRLSQK